MTTLAKRATPRQAQVMRMIEGAVRNAAHAHPDWKIHPRLARSVAKRATGTLTSQWGSVLAATTKPSDRKGADLQGAISDRLAEPHEPIGEGAPEGAGCAGGASQRLRRPPDIAYVARAIGAMAGDARRAGNRERVQALADVLLTMAAIRVHQGPLPRRWPVPR